MGDRCWNGNGDGGSGGSGGAGIDEAWFRSKQTAVDGLSSGQDSSGVCGDGRELDRHRVRSFPRGSREGMWLRKTGESSKQSHGISPNPGRL